MCQVKIDQAFVSYVKGKKKRDRLAPTSCLGERKTREFRFPIWKKSRVQMTYVRLIRLALFFFSIQYHVKLDPT
jgi:hypothetical protein